MTRTSIRLRQNGKESSSSMTSMLAGSEFVSTHSPLTPATRHIIGWEELVKMKPTAFLVNTSRRGTVDTDAVVRALQEKEMAGAGLDVTEPELLPDGHPLFSIEYVILTPRAADAAPEMIARTGSMSAADRLRGTASVTWSIPKSGPSSKRASRVSRWGARDEPD
jgi:phosphoglycerate dehydrogenase-like enzyme